MLPHTIQPLFGGAQPEFRNSPKVLLPMIPAEKTYPKIYELMKYWWKLVFFPAFEMEMSDQSKVKSQMVEEKMFSFLGSQIKNPGTSPLANRILWLHGNWNSTSRTGSSVYFSEARAVALAVRLALHPEGRL